MAITVERVRVSCDTADEAASLYNLIAHQEAPAPLPEPVVRLPLAAPVGEDEPVLKKPSKPRPKRQPAKPVAKIKSKPTTNAARGADRKDQIEAILRKAGKPMRKSAIAREANVSASAITPHARDPRFVETAGGLLWLAGEEDGESDDEEEEPADDGTVTEDEADPWEGPPPSKAGVRTDTPTVKELQNWIKKCGPLDLEEIAEVSKCSQHNCFRVLQDAAFERDTQGLYWLAKP